MSEFADELTSVVAKLASTQGEATPGALPPVWDDIVELGLVGIGTPEEQGGSGGGLDDLVLVVEELARHGLGTPLVEAAITAELLAAIPSTGFATIAIAPHGLSIVGGAVSGDVLAPWALDAERLVLVTDSGVHVVDLEDGAAGREPAPDIAGLQRARVSLASAPSVTLSADPDTVRARLGLLRAASLLGAGRGALDLTRGYLLVRQQFGAPLLKLPAVAAALARMHTELTQTEAALERAIAVLARPDADPASARDAAAVARVVASTMATFVARQSHQLHGAMGVAGEYPLHRFSRALWAWRDADESELTSALHLGSRALEMSQEQLWDVLTA